MSYSSGWHSYAPVKPYDTRKLEDYACDECQGQERYLKNLDCCRCPLSEVLKKFKGTEITIFFKDLESNGPSPRNLTGQVMSVCGDVLEFCETGSGVVFWVNICCICYFRCA